MAITTEERQQVEIPFLEYSFNTFLKKVRSDHYVSFQIDAFSPLQYEAEAPRGNE